MGKGREGTGKNFPPSLILKLALSQCFEIFVSEPYFNEPGYDKLRGDPKSSSAALQYYPLVTSGSKTHPPTGCIIFLISTSQPYDGKIPILKEFCPFPPSYRNFVG